MTTHLRHTGRRSGLLRNGSARVEAGRCVLVSMLGLLMFGCATMSIPQTQVRPTESYQLTTERNALFIAVHPVTDSAEIEEAFRTNLLEKGILPILVVVENRNPLTSFVLAKNKVAVVNVASLETTTSQRRRVTSDIPGAAVATAGAAALSLPGAAALSLPLVVVGLKIMSDAQVIAHNLGEKEFYSRTVAPGQKAHGYIYFQLPRGTTALEHHQLLVEAVDSSTGETVRFDFPLEYRKR
jgi:hypothetical protein